MKDRPSSYTYSVWMESQLSLSISKWTFRTILIRSFLPWNAIFLLLVIMTRNPRNPKSAAHAEKISPKNDSLTKSGNCIAPCACVHAHVQNWGSIDQYVSWTIPPPQLCIQQHIGEDWLLRPLLKRWAFRPAVFILNWCFAPFERRKIEQWSLLSGGIYSAECFQSQAALVISILLHSLLSSIQRVYMKARAE